MNAVFNGSYIESASLTLEITNRGFLYADGLFETIIAKDGRIQYIKDHIERLHRGMRIFKMTVSPLLSQEKLEEYINGLVQNNRLNEARIKVLVWRKPGGLFIPETDEIEFLIQCNDIKQQAIKARKTDFCNSISLHESIYSEFKRISSLPYVLAGVELKERGLDDLILLDNEGNVSECIYSNIFWKKGNKYFTPSLDTGCIAGVRRKNIIQRLKQTSIEIEEVRNKPGDLLSADHVFSTNVAGIYPIIEIGGQKFKSNIPEFL